MRLVLSQRKHKTKLEYLSWGKIASRPFPLSFYLQNGIVYGCSTIFYSIFAKGIVFVLGKLYNDGKSI